MGKWKAKPGRTHARGQVLASVAEHEAASHAQVRETIGEDRELRATPAWQVPISSIVIELILPHRGVTDAPDSAEEISMLANLATMAWNASRAAASSEAIAATLAGPEWQTIWRESPEMEALWGAMLSQARSMYPSDTRYILRADVVMKNGQPFVHATSTPGEAAFRE